MDHRSRTLLIWLNAQENIQPTNFHMISGDASFRRYFRFSSNECSYLAVDAPPATEKNQQFVTLSREISRTGIRVPEVIAQDFESGFLLIEDFGNAMFSDCLTEQKASHLYKQALAVLPNLQKLTHPDASGTEYNLPSYNQGLLQVEAEMFSHWLLKVHLDLSTTKAQNQLIEHLQRYLAIIFASQPQVGVHRDFHSRNLMLLNDNKNNSIEIGVIDFQDMVKGPLTYDMVSLLRDCYVTWPDEFVEQQLRDLHHSAYQQYDWLTFKHWFDCTGIQRHLKAAGIFARLCHRDKKPHYLKDIPVALNYVVSVAKQLSQDHELRWMAELSHFLTETVLPRLSQIENDAIPIQKGEE